jgi:hypothetical protein
MFSQLRINLNRGNEIFSALLKGSRFCLLLYKTFPLQDEMNIGKIPASEIKREYGDEDLRELQSRKKLFRMD